MFNIRKIKKIIVPIIVLKIMLISIVSNFSLIAFYGKLTNKLISMNEALPVLSSNFYNDPISENIVKDITYKERDNKEYKLDLYPSQKNSSESSPVIIYVFGNGWTGGEKSIPAGLMPILELLREEGFSIISTSYELMDDKLIFENQVSDIKDTIKWIYKNKAIYNFDTDSIGIIAPSAGAQLSMLAAYSNENQFVGDKSLQAYPSKISYLIDLFGPTELSKVNLTQGSKQLYDELKLNDLNKISKLYSPMEYIKAGLPDTLIIHSKKDIVVPYNSSIELLNKGLEFGNDFEFYTLDSCTHYLEELTDLEATGLYFKIMNYIISKSKVGA